MCSSRSGFKWLWFRCSMLKSASPYPKADLFALMWNYAFINLSTHCQILVHCTLRNVLSVQVLTLSMTLYLSIPFVFGICSMSWVILSDTILNKHRSLQQRDSFIHWFYSTHLSTFWMCSTVWAPTENLHFVPFTHFVYTSSHHLVHPSLCPVEQQLLRHLTMNHK